MTWHHLCSAAPGLSTKAYAQARAPDLTRRNGNAARFVTAHGPVLGILIRTGFRSRCGLAQTLRSRLAERLNRELSGRVAAHHASDQRLRHISFAQAGQRIPGAGGCGPRAIATHSLRTPRPARGPELVAWVRIRVRRWRMSAQNGRWKDRMSQSDLDAVDWGIPAIAPRGGSSHETLRWRKADSNPRSHSYGRVCRALPKGDPGTTGWGPVLSSGPLARCRLAAGALSVAVSYTGDRDFESRLLQQRVRTFGTARSGRYACHATVAAKDYIFTAYPKR
jgi:hypothetical protein